MQYMLGSSLLVAPLCSADGSVQYYLPAGEWRHLLTGDVRQGGAWFTDSCDYFSLSFWVRVESAGKWKCLEGFSG
jgi:alpha-D-xyloside xylohydrolase